MNSSPRGSRKHIVFYGRRNVGKSSLMNRILNQEVSLVSDVKGTTTDVVSKAMEVHPLGPVLFMDTGGIDDFGDLGKLRVEKTKETLNLADLAIYVLSAGDYKDALMEDMVGEFKRKNIPYIVVVNKRDLLDEDGMDEVRSYLLDMGIDRDQSIFTSIGDSETISGLKDKVIDRLLDEVGETSFIGDLVPRNGRVVLVIDNDSAAPKGRIILPQVQILRDALDNGIKSYVVRNSELESALDDMEDIDLVITDSKIFKEVDLKTKKSINITSFSILMAREKGDLKTFIEGVKSLEKLKGRKGINILISEACSHTPTHEDIGQVKIPNMLRKFLGEDIKISFKSGGQFHLSPDVDFVIHCGGCMLNQRNMGSRIEACREKNIPITNYGIFISFMLGILDRAVEVFELD